MGFLELTGLSKVYGERYVLRDVNMTVNRGDFISLLGHSGCGKTTLLRIISGLEHADDGAILLEGTPITNTPVYERGISIVFQNYALFPHMTVFQNVAYGLKIRRCGRAEIARRTHEVLEKVNLLSKAHQNVTVLSGGEQQRVALARAIVIEPRIVLLDEPLSNLDYALKQQARNELKRLQNDIGITFIYVTHDQLEALALSDKVAVMNQGSIVQFGNPKEIYHHPINSFVASFVGRYNIFNSSPSRHLLQQEIVDDALLLVLPEHLNISKADEATGLKITDISFVGAFTEYVLSDGYRMLKSICFSTDELHDFQIGDSVAISASHDNMKLVYA